MIPIRLTDVLEIINKISTVAGKIKNTELNTSIIELQSKVMTLQQEIITLTNKHNELLHKLQEKEQYNMVFENKAYWNIKPDGTKEGPYCSACKDGHQKHVRMITHKMAFCNSSYYCPVCGHDTNR